MATVCSITPVSGFNFPSGTCSNRLDLALDSFLVVRIGRSSRSRLHVCSLGDKLLVSSSTDLERSFAVLEAGREILLTQQAAADDPSCDDSDEDNRDLR